LPVRGFDRSRSGGQLRIEQRALLPEPFDFLAQLLALVGQLCDFQLGVFRLNLVQLVLNAGSP
jgi:hypothetical protein